jgi:hypothetical protein
MEVKGLHKTLRNTGFSLLTLVEYTAQCEQQNKSRENFLTLHIQYNIC